TLRVSQTEGNIAILPCGGKTTGSVTWSRDTNGQREDILNTTNGKTTKLISDPDTRYSAGVDLVLYILRVSQSDAGRYYCGGATVELTVTDHVVRVNQTEGTQAILHCGTQTTGTVTWSRDTNGQRVDILNTTNGEVMYSADSRYTTGRSLTLIIPGVSRSDAGTYYCNRATVELTVIPGTVLFLISTVVSCLATLVLLLILWRRFYKNNAAHAVSRNQDHVYETIECTTPSAQPETLRVNQTEGNIAILPCGGKTTDSVTWSRDTNGQREDILTITNGNKTKHISDPDRRYGAGGNLVLTIFRVSQSDAGRYYCGAATVELTVTAKPKTLHVRETEGNTAILPCGRQTTGTVTWSRYTNGQRVDILSTTNGKTRKRIADPDRYDLGANLTLIIYGVSQSDAGRYFCNLLTVELTVTVGDGEMLYDDVYTYTEYVNVNKERAETLRVSQTEGKIAKLPCGGKTTGSVTWSRDTNGQREDILTTTNGETTKHISDPDGRYSAGADLVLTIFRVSQSDAGRYYCGGATVELTVTDMCNCVCVCIGNIDVLIKYQHWPPVRAVSELMQTMKLLLLTCLLLYGSIPTAQSETLRVSQTEGKMARLPCGGITTGSVTWSRDTNGQREDILTTTNGKTTKHISDPDRRYGSQADLTLTIRRVSQSDAGRYYCGGATVELTVTDQTLRVTEGTQAVLHCGTQTTGTVTWSRDTNGQREDILTTTNGEVMYSADSRYTTGRSLALVIYQVSRSDAGTYYCNRTTVELTVIPGTDPDSRTTTRPAPEATTPTITSTPAPEATTTTTTSTPAPDATTTTATSTPAPEATTTTTTSRSATKATTPTIINTLALKATTTTITSTPAPEATTSTITSTPAPEATTSTITSTPAPEAGSTTTETGLWKFLVIAAVSCLVVVVLLVLISLRCFFDRKEDGEMLYDDVYTFAKCDNKEQADAMESRLDLSRYFPQTLVSQDLTQILVSRYCTQMPWKTLRVSETEGKVARLPCGGKTTGSVTWSRDTNGQREDILTTTNGKTTKLISDPDGRYGAGADLVLTIFRVSQSDAGRYYCGGATVELTVTNQTLRVTEGTQATLHCGTQTTGTVTWSRDTNGQREDILTTTNGEIMYSADSRYTTGRSLTLIIPGVSRSDAGTYYCHRATVELTVIPGTGCWLLLRQQEVNRSSRQGSGQPMIFWAVFMTLCEQLLYHVEIQKQSLCCAFLTKAMVLVVQERSSEMCVARKLKDKTLSTPSPLMYMYTAPPCRKSIMSSFVFEEFR
ncbi:hypothetical protein NFI96_010663, partial [Prochilodus magdalenae]